MSPQLPDGATAWVVEMTNLDGALAQPTESPQRLVDLSSGSGEYGSSPSWSSSLP